MDVTLVIKLEAGRTCEVLFRELGSFNVNSSGDIALFDDDSADPVAFYPGNKWVTMEADQR